MQFIEPAVKIHIKYVASYDYYVRPGLGSRRSPLFMLDNKSEPTFDAFV